MESATTSEIDSKEVNSNLLLEILDLKLHVRELQQVIAVERSAAREAGRWLAVIMREIEGDEDALLRAYHGGLDRGDNRRNDDKVSPGSRVDDDTRGVALRTSAKIGGN